MPVFDLPEVQEKNFSKLEEDFGIKFKNKDLLTQAFIHRSYLNEHHDFPLGHNERLEFLGDAVLELVVTEFLFEEYGNPEGELTNWRAALVNASQHCLRNWHGALFIFKSRRIQRFRHQSPRLHHGQHH